MSAAHPLQEERELLYTNAIWGHPIVTAEAVCLNLHERILPPFVATVLLPPWCNVKNVSLSVQIKPGNAKDLFYFRETLCTCFLIDPVLTLWQSPSCVDASIHSSALFLYYNVAWQNTQAQQVHSNKKTHWINSIQFWEGFPSNNYMQLQLKSSTSVQSNLIKLVQLILIKYSSNKITVFTKLN